jgi:beta-lactamase regulating signal transducer with metallopeptidase domain
MSVVELALCAWIVFAILTVAAGSLGFAWVSKKTRDWSPAERANALTLFGLAPLLVPTVAVVLCFVPSLFHLVSGTPDHCAQHDDLHPHFCLIHRVAPGTSYGWIVVFAIAVLALVRLAPVALVAIRASLHARDLSRHAGEDHVVSSAVPLALTVGWIRPRPLVSTGLVDRIEPRLAEAVLAHERAHATRGDNLRKLVVSLVARLYPIGGRLVSELTLACELAADEQAAREMGDRVLVAEAIVAATRAGANVQTAWSSAVMCCVEQRVEALLDEPRPASRGSWRIVLGLAALVAVLTSDPLHDAVENLLSCLVA